ncbi:hypothetical protein B0T17DRAFT_618954 [Bombardia bombarda]|uniref:Uncharacterized protein n=1 Tax=Bombardia bombarda TaxID=252184 RepID=A0AA39WMX0_9PEZI|nr:hypothetical protein B0T17DRAFT_618954 [Bombardia bombarda]
MASSHLQSSGRGGAGNIVDSAKSPRIQEADLQTPTLKTSVVTTGRGGTGNMAKNSDPVETRLRQDVAPVVRRSSQGATHIGRGGGGNVFNPEDAQTAKKEQEKGASAIADDGPAKTPAKTSVKKSDEPGWAEKGRNLLFGKRS